MLNELITTLKLNILNIGYREHTSDWLFKDVISPFSRMYFVTEGEAYINHHGHEFHLTPGTIHLVPCFTLSEYRCPSRFRLYYIHFTSRIEGGMDICNIGKYTYQVEAEERHYDLFSRLVALMPGMTIDKCSPHSISDKRTIIKELGNSKTDLPAYAILEADGIFRQILSVFLDTISDVEGIPPGYFTEVLEYIEANLSNRISLSDLASIARRHPNYFSDQFIRLFGVRPIEYINRRRIEKAQSLILANMFSIKEVAARTGFKGVAYFSRTFKKYTGVSPSRYLAEMNL